MGYFESVNFSFFDQKNFKNPQPTVSAAFSSLTSFGKKVDLKRCTSSVTSSSFIETNC